MPRENIRLRRTGTLAALLLLLQFCICSIALAVTPTITGYSPISGTVGTTVTITGTGFSTTPALDLVSLGTVTAATSTSLTLNVSPDATTGDFTVAVKAATGGGIALATCAIQGNPPAGRSGTPQATNCYFTVIPQITGFQSGGSAITSAKAGDTIDIIGTGFSTTPAQNTVNFFDAIQATVTAATSTKLTVVVPSGASTGAVSVTTSGGTATSSSFTMIVPTITGFSPASGKIGDSIALTGTLFQTKPVSNIIYFAGNGGLVQTTASSVTDSGHLTVTVPPNAIKGNIYLSNFYGTSPIAPTPFFVVPSISSLNHVSGLVGDSIEINGTGFDSSSNQVTFSSGVTAGITAATPIKLTVTVPLGAITGPITVTTNGGSVQSGNFSVIPNITSVVGPGGNPNGSFGDIAIIRGSGFDPMPGHDTISISYTGASAPPVTITYSNSQQLRFTIPAGAISGSVWVTTAGGISNSAAFTVIPKISSISPVAANVDDVPVTISGGGFDATLSPHDTVSFNGTPATQFDSAVVGALTVRVPAGTTSGPVTVTNAGGTSNGFNFQVIPKVTSLSAPTGYIGDALTITGKGFDPRTPTNGNVVTFSGASGPITATVTSWNSTTLQLTVPAGAIKGAVTVTTNGVASNTTNFSVLPKIASLDKYLGSVNDTVNITGSGFDSTSNVVTFNGLPATITSATPIAIAAKVPSGAPTGPGSLIVTTNGGSAQTTFTVVPPPPVSDPPAATSTPSRDATSDSVGATLAQFRVDEGGNATYSIPIQVPPGTAGVAPKLALSYNSRMPSGVMGPGWTVEGASQISRCRQTRENGDFMSGTTPLDGNPSPVNFTTSDRFCLDGVRLLLLSGSYGSDLSTYSPESDPTTRVTVHLASASNPAPGPLTFTVQRKDGTSSTYGATTASPNAGPTASVNSQTVNVAWNLARVQDSVGNYMDYLYNSRPASGTYGFAAGAVETTLAQVNYTGHVSPLSSTYASVTFSYSTLPVNQVHLGFQAGVAFVQSQQLQNVTVADATASPSTLRSYQLTYQTSASGSGLLQLAQVQECSLSACYPATTFNWSTANYSITSEGTQTATKDFTALRSYKVADVDGDGRMDFVFAMNDGACSSASSIYVAFLDRNTSTNQMMLNLASQTKTCALMDLSGNDQAWYLVDYDGDGLADLMMGGASASTWEIHLSQGRPASGGAVFGTTNVIAGLATPIKAPSCYTTTTGTVCNPAAGILADLNGDGLPDFLYPNPDPLSSQTLLARMMVRNGSGVFQFSEPYTVTLGNASAFDDPCTSVDTCNIGLFSNDTYNRSAIATDLNGDGRADLTFAVTGVTNNSGSSTSGTSRTTRLSYAPIGAITGSSPSGSPSSVITRNTYWYQFTTQTIDPTAKTISMGLYWHAQAQTPAFPSAILPAQAQRFFVADINGDGLADILYQDPSTASSSTTTYMLLLNTGSTYLAPISVSGIVTNSTDLVSHWPTIQLADVNGDGRLDILYPSVATGTGVYNYVTLLPDTNAASGWSFSSAQAAPAGLQAKAGSYALIADLDGDAITDLLRVDNNSTTYYTARTTSGNRYAAHDVVTGFTNGLGANTTVNYQPLTNHGVYQWGINAVSGTTRTRALNASNWGYGSPVFDVLAPMYVVSQASSSAPTQGAPSHTSTVYYRYQGAAMQAGGRGFLGFWAIWAFDNNDTAIEGNKYMVTLNGYGQQFPFIGFPENTYKMAFSGALTRGINGDTTLDACATNGPEANTTCFAPGLPNSASTDPTQWPDIKNNGVVVSSSETYPYCTGAGCAAVPVTYTNLCTGASTSIAARSSDVGQITNNIFAAPAAAGPIFTYALNSTDAQYDLGDAPGFSGAIATAAVQSTYCYDTNVPARGNLVNSSVITRDASTGSFGITAQKYTANTYGSDNTAQWFLGRLTQSAVTFIRGADSRTRTTTFAYDPTTGLLTSERIQANGAADQDLRTLYVLDTYGNRTAAYQCSKELSDTQCKSTSGFVQQQSGTQVHRYAKTTFDSRGRYSTSSRLPFSGVDGSNNVILSEQQAMSVGARDEFGNPTSQSSINGLTQTSEAGSLGRPYFAADNTGKSSKTTFRLCGTGTGKVGCSSDTLFKFRSETKTAGAPTTWTYYDLLGRPVMKIGQNFNIENNTAGQLYSGTCGYFDSHNRPLYQSEPFFVNAAEAADSSPNLPTTMASPCSSAIASTTTRYDVLGRVTSVTAPDNGVINKTYIGLTTFTSSPRNIGWTWEETKNGLGEVIETRDPDDASDANDNLIVNTYYDATGNVSQVTRNAGSGLITTSANYDMLGRKLNQTDPDAGYTSYTYNAAGDVVSQTDAKGTLVSQSYDAMGRRWQRANTCSPGTCTSFTDTWTYDTAANGYGQLATKSRPAIGTQQPFTRSYVYDNKGRLYQRRTTVTVTSTYAETTAYDAVGRVKSQQDASGFTLDPHYTTHGFVDYQSDSRTGTHTYQMLSANERGQVVSDQRGGIAAMTSVHSYNSQTGRLYQLCSGNGASLSTGNCVGGNLQNLAYNFDLAGNLSARGHVISNQSIVEFFKYDALNRLTTVGVPQANTVLTQNPVITAAMTMVYDKLGNICSKTTSAGTQTYTYFGLAGCTNHGSSGSPHAVKSISGVASLTYAYDADGNQINTTGGSGRALTFDALNQMTKATNSTDTANFQYAESGDRFQRIDQNGTRTTYIGNVEVVVSGTSTEYRRYLAGVAIDYVRTGGSNETRYLFGDHLGSTDVIAKSDGSLFEQTSFDAHGSRRDSSSWSGSGTPTASTTHGFTGHEQLDSLGLIHMNGRVYDPQLGRMLQADPLTGPGPQGLNRYAYVANNPLTLTDPSGYSWWGNVLRAVAAIAIAIFAPELLPVLQCFWGAVAIGFVSGYVATGTLQGALVGAFSAGLFYGVGQAFKEMSWAHEGGTIGATNLNAAGFSAKILAHGVAGGVMSELQGGKFGNGFLSAGVAEAAGPGIDSLDKASPVGQSISAQRIVVAAVVGGTTSVLTGGKFANGAITGAFSRAFNDDNPFHKPNYKEFTPLKPVAEADANIGIKRNNILGTEVDVSKDGQLEVTLAQGHYEWVGGGVQIVDQQLGVYLDVGPQFETQYGGAEAVCRLSTITGFSMEASAEAGIPNFYSIKASASLKNWSISNATYDATTVVPNNIEALRNNINEAATPRYYQDTHTMEPDWLHKLLGNGDY